VFLKSLQLWDFRNYSDEAIDFVSPKTILVGNNAQGKSNVLEAMQLLATGRSTRAQRDRELVLQGKEQGRISAMVERLDTLIELELTLRVGRRRTVRLNGESQRRQADVLGYLNCVSFSSLDLDLVRGSPENRRLWIDGILLQVEPVYASLIEQYGHILQQRNALLKLPSPDQVEQLTLWDEQLIRAGSQILRRRYRLLNRLAPIAERWHRAISGGNETFRLRYLPQVDEWEDSPQSVQAAFQAALQTRQPLELMRGTTLVGPHRDEIDLSIDEVPARQYGSQGQQRTLVLALKLAELELLEQVTGQIPLLLLDDVLAELDLHRQDQLLGAIGDRVQTIVTTTHLGLFDSQWLRSATILTVEQGKIAHKKTSA
jgi:DNA replication and repair protein RecF